MEAWRGTPFGPASPVPESKHITIVPYHLAQLFSTPGCIVELFETLLKGLHPSPWNSNLIGTVIGPFYSSPGNSHGSEA